MIKIAFMVAGLVLLALATALGLSVRGFAHAASSADGVVVRLNAGGSHPQIDFVTAIGEKVSYPQGGFIFGARVGDKVRVLYMPDAPRSTARIDTIGTLWFVPLLVFALGIVMLICGASAGSTSAGTGIETSRG